MLPERQKMPGFARLINKIGEQFNERLQSFVRLDKDELMETAANRLSLSDFGDPYFKEGLACLIDSLNHDADLTYLGRILQRTVINRSLENRLEFIDFKKRNPEIFTKKINPPIIIVGLPRTGTTFLHRLLAQDPENRGLYFWELIRPIPSKAGTDFRKIRAKIEYLTYRYLSKQFDHIHVVRDDEYEECILLMTLTFQSIAFYMMAPVYSYVKWCLRAERTKRYDEYFQLLKIYQSATPDKRLTLKAPAHAGSINEIKNQCPEAMLIQTHRHPVDICSSSYSLVYSAHCNVVKRLDVRKMAECTSDFLEYETNINMAVRKNRDIDVYDVLFEELCDDPFAVVKRFYNRQGMTMNDHVEAAMKAFINRNPRHKHGKHKYSADDFGIKDEQIIERFASYMTEFGYKAPLIG